MVRRGYVDTPGGQIHFYAAGDRGPLVFLFHETALSGNEFEKTLPILATRCRAIALDTPGYGMSDPPPGPPTMDDLVEPLLTAMVHFGPGPYVLAGAHTGASLAIEMAANRIPADVSHVMLTGLALLKPSEIDAFRRIIGTPVIDRDGKYLIEQWQKRVKRWGADTDLAGLHWGAVEQLKVYSRFHWAFEAVFQHDAEGALARLRCPTFFLIGDRDSLVESDRRAAELVKGAKLKVLSEVRGRLPYFHPEVYAHELIAFAGLA